MLLIKSNKRFLRLSRPAVRKGCAFPLAATFISGKAQPCQLRGYASLKIEEDTGRKAIGFLHS
jgi:hypothetical protein